MDDLGWDDVAPSLVVAVSPAIYQGGFPAPLVRVAFVPLVYAHAAIATGDTLRILEAGEAPRLGKTFQELIARGIRNVSEREVRLEPIGGDEEWGVFELVAEDGCEAAWPLVPGWLASLEDVVDGPPVCAIPSSRTCLVANGSSAAALERLLEQAIQTWEASDAPISPVLYSAHEDHLAPLALDDEHPLSPRLQHAHALFVAHEYEAQATAIEAALEDAPGDLAVGSCRVFPHPSGASFTASTFVEGFDVLLPESDLVLLAWREGDAPEYVLVTRQDLVRFAPHRLIPVPDYDPPRIATVGFPNDAEREALRGVALAAGLWEQETEPET